LISNVLVTPAAATLNAFRIVPSTPYCERRLADDDRS